MRKIPNILFNDNYPDSTGVEAFAISEINSYLGAPLNLVGAGAGTSSMLSQ